MLDYQYKAATSPERHEMAAAALGLVVVFLVIGAVVGWVGQKTYSAHADVKVAKNRLKGGRQTRWRGSVWVVVIAIVLILGSIDIFHS